MICPSFRKRSLLPLATLFAIAQAASTALAQSETPSDYLQINAESVQTFNDGTAQIIVVSKPLTIETDGTKLSADSAVIWITPQPGALSRQRAEIALIGNATLVQPTNSRTGDRLFVSTVVGGSLRLCVQSRDNSDPRQLPLYKTAADIRPMILAAAERQDNLSIQRPWIDDTSTQPATMPTTLPSPNSPVTFSASDVQTTTNTPDGKIAAILRGKVLLMQRRPNGDLIELQAQECVLFTNLTNFTQMQNGSSDMSGAVVAAYMEGDVRINVTPAPKIGGGHAIGEQRMRADRVYYEFATDRAIMTHVVLQTGDPRLPFPITMRANVAKQLAMGEYDTQKTVLTTSQFLDPSYSINSDKVYIRQYNLDDGYGPRTAYQADDATFKVMNTPVFYLPTATGEFSQEGEAVRKLELGSGRGSGFGIETQWGLFQSAGLLPPPGIDADYEIDYFSDRGPGFGFDTSYKGGELAQTTKDGWNFNGDFTSYILPQDSGTDKLGHERVSIPHNDDTRGYLLWEHQQILPDDWELQVRAGYASDPTFLEEWYEKQFNDGDPTNLSLYLKHQKDTEAVTFLMEYQPNGFVTNADSLQNRFVGNRNDPATGALGSLNDRPFEVDRLPEIGYYRIGDAVADDKLTFFSENRAGGYRMNEGDAILGTVGDDPTQGITNNFDNSYGFVTNGSRDRFSTPGIPSLGYTGTSEDYVLRADSRQEIDYPIDAGQFKIVPYVMGRYTGYSDSPDGDPQNRVIAGTGLRMTTAFWKTDDQAESDFFDIHRVRHVIEPELNLFTSGSSVDRNDLYVYDDTVDGVTDVSAASFWIRQRWETKRGGPGLWRSTDFFTFDVGITGFANSPTDPSNPDREYVDNPSSPFFGDRNRFGPQSASAFRGLFFESEPEASVPRSNIAAQSTWRISDTTIMLGDANWNIQHQELATAAVGLLVGRGDRVTYYAGLRYIGELDSTVASFSSTYQLSAKYTINFAAAVDLASTSSKGGSFSIIRKFDRFYMGVGAYYDAVENQSGFTVSLYPEGAVGGVNTGQLQKLQQ